MNEINVLGQKYEIKFLESDINEGLADVISKVLVIDYKTHDIKKVIAHEIIHAFLYEAGIADIIYELQNEEVTTFFGFHFENMNECRTQVIKMYEEFMDSCSTEE